MFLKNSRFAEVYCDYFPVIYSIVFRKIGNIEDCEDLCQEIFLHFYNKMDEVENNRKWLYGTMKFVLLNYYRKKRPGDVNIDDLDNDDRIAFVNGFRDTRLMIDEAIENEENYFDEKERILFDLIAIRNFSYEEAGSHVGLSKTQARYRYGKIVERIVGYFKKKGITVLEELL